MNTDATPENGVGLTQIAPFVKELDAPLSKLIAGLRSAEGAWGRGRLGDQVALAERLAALVRGICAVTAPSSVLGAAELVDVHDAIELAIELTWHQVAARACLSRLYRPLPRVRVHLPALARAVIALLRNAAEAIPEIIPGANTIRIETDVRPESLVTIDVGDTGVGIPPADLERIFEPFFTTKDRPSVGLGLAAAREALAAAGGAITVESEVGYGSCFRITLPASDPATDGVVRVTRADALPVRRVLVVAGDVTEARALAAQVETEDTSVTYADCEEALERLGLAEPFELIVWEAQRWVAGRYCERLAQVAPAALSRTFAWKAALASGRRLETEVRAPRAP